MSANENVSPSTSLSLLDRLCSTPDEEAWRQLTNLYTSLIRSWIRSHAVTEEDTDDLVQEVLLVVLHKLPDFEHNRRTGAFRRWLRSITINCLRKFWDAKRLRPRATGDSDFLKLLAQLEDPDSGLSRQWDREHDLHVTHRFLESLRSQFEAVTWRAFCAVSLEGRSGADVAQELGVSVNAVYIAKSRVLAKLRQESGGILD